IEPRTQRRPPFEAVVGTPGTDQRLLDGVLGLERRAEHAVAVARELGAMLLEPELELTVHWLERARRFLQRAHPTNPRTGVEAVPVTICLYRRGYTEKLIGGLTP